MAYFHILLSNSMNLKKYTLVSPLFDGIFFFSPFLVIFLFTLLTTSLFPQVLDDSVSPIWFFVFLIVFDTGHVWATLLRTYDRKNIRIQKRKILTTIPIVSFFILFILSIFGMQSTDWTILPFMFIAYMAVFHFIKQQVGFIQLYHHKESIPKSLRTVSTFANKWIWWSSTLFPFLWWMMEYEDKNFEWFMKWEFTFLANIIPHFSGIWILFGGIVMLYILIECIIIFFWWKLNPLKILYIIGTFGVWYSGMVVHNNVFIFGFGNVLLHAMNYYGIVIASTQNNPKDYRVWLQNRILSHNIYAISLILMSTIVIFAFVEEYFWDQFIWQSESRFFWDFLYNTIHNPIILAVIFSLLGSIQVSHYLLDRYIWKKDFGKIF